MSVGREEMEDDIGHRRAQPYKPVLGGRTLNAAIRGGTVYYKSAGDGDYHSAPSKLVDQLARLEAMADKGGSGQP